MIGLSLLVNLLSVYSYGTIVEPCKAPEKFNETFNGNYYYGGRAENEEGFSHQQAANYCSSIGGRLPEPANQQEMDFITGIVSWVDTTEPDDGFYLGFEMEGRKGIVLSSTSGREALFQNFERNQPNYIRNNQKCVQTIKNWTDSGKNWLWNDCSCSDRFTVIVCEFLCIEQTADAAVDIELSLRLPDTNSVCTESTEVITCRAVLNSSLPDGQLLFLAIVSTRHTKIPDDVFNSAKNDGTWTNMSDNGSYEVTVPAKLGSFEYTCAAAIGIELNRQRKLVLNRVNITKTIPCVTKVMTNVIDSLARIETFLNHSVSKLEHRLSVLTDLTERNNRKIQSNQSKQIALNDNQTENRLLGVLLHDVHELTELSKHETHEQLVSATALGLISFLILGLATVVLCYVWSTRSARNSHRTTVSSATSEGQRRQSRQYKSGGIYDACLTVDHRRPSDSTGIAALAQLYKQTPTTAAKAPAVRESQHSFVTL